MKKKISLATIICIGLSALISTLALFGILKITGIIFDLLFTLLTLTITGILTINSCKMLEEKNKLAIISFSLTTLSSILVILCFWTTLDNFAFFSKLVLVSSVLSICFNLIVSNILKIGKNYKALQIAAYTCYSLVSLYLILTFLDLIKLTNINLKLFILFIILSFGAMFTLAVISKKQTKEVKENKEYIKISKEEYNQLLSYKYKIEKILKEADKND